MKMATKNQPAKPVGEIKVYPVRAAIWRNEGENGVFYNATVERSYKDGDSYKSSGSFSADDLLKLAKVADQAHSWIMRQRGEGLRSQAGMSRIRTIAALCVSGRSILQAQGRRLGIRPFINGTPGRSPVACRWWRIRRAVAGRSF